MLVAGLALVSLPVAAYAAVLAPGPHSSFTVRGANIYDPLGHRFIVRGAVIAPGALTDPQGGFDAKELAGVKHDAKVLASMGVNTVRLDVSAVANSDERLAAIRRAVTAARSAHLIVILSAHGGTSRAGARVRGLPRRALPQGPRRLAAAGLRPLVRRSRRRSQPLHLLVGLARRAARARACHPQRRACTRRSCSRRPAARVTCACSRTTT